ncbi:nitrite reductase small subunit NirD [Amphritea balenae]|uniref:Nitrite reductase small subunit NirD n=1 Tax=Amphritea balenae TaxID=452629 RepID=A0A3P1SW51_9GAMM|nr:nitrite reductase small subunit NirD [Amphritea balenae]RRD01340.1 nitrite reductase small subunit NirD [Amphritea balenae]GGK57946.1 nitrite reductase small subunit [Amphritea balenae]
MTSSTHWTTVCKQTDLVLDSGICALVNEIQVALFCLPSQDAVFAIANTDPFSQANVLSRGLVGSLGEDLVVASPVYKQHFCLRSGRCFEDESQSISSWPARIENGNVEILI